MTDEMIERLALASCLLWNISYPKVFTTCNGCETEENCTDWCRHYKIGKDQVAVEIFYWRTIALCKEAGAPIKGYQAEINQIKKDLWTLHAVMSNSIHSELRCDASYELGRIQEKARNGVNPDEKGTLKAMKEKAIYNFEKAEKYGHLEAKKWIKKLEEESDE